MVGNVVSNATAASSCPCAPSPGTYRLFLDFRHGDVVRTAAFTVAVGGHEGAHG